MKRSRASEVPGDHPEIVDVECCRAPERDRADELSGESGPRMPLQETERKGPLRQTRLCLDISADESLKKLVADKELQIEEMQQKLASQEGECQRLRAVVVECGDAAASAQSRVQRFKDVLRGVMVESALTARREARRLEHNIHFELGQILSCQSPTGPREMWVEGNAKRELDKKSATIGARFSEVEALKKNAERRLKMSKVDEETSNGFVSDAWVEAEAQVQMCKQELESLQAAQSELQRQLEDLKSRKTAFLKEIRRITDEDSSEFAGVESIQQRYVLIHLLGKGGFSEVWKAFDLEEARYVACKIHRISKEWNSQARAHYLRHAERELEIMRRLDHPRLTKLYDVFEEDRDTFVSVQELSEGSDLDTHLKRHSRMREQDARVILIQLVAALRHLAEQEQPIIHFDLKPANILFHSSISSCLDIKVTDFGLSKVIHDAENSNDPSIELTSQGTGTYWYLPPECFETSATPRITPKVDVWALGIILFQMLFGRRPFAEGQSQRRIWHDRLIVNNAKTLEFPSAPRVSDGAKEFIQKCLTYSPTERPDIFELSQDAYLRAPARKRSSAAASSKAPTAAPSSDAI